MINTKKRWVPLTPISNHRQIPHLNDLLDLDIIERVEEHSSLVSPVICVPKRSGVDIRLRRYESCEYQCEVCRCYIKFTKYFTRVHVLK
jgi:hypothetical protein